MKTDTDSGPSEGGIHTQIPEAEPLHQPTKRGKHQGILMRSGQQTTSLMDNELRRRRISLSQNLAKVKNGQTTETEQRLVVTGAGERKDGE